MHPQLLICKRKMHNRTGFETRITFVIVDASKPDPYPSNFVCVIPQSRSALLNGSPCRKQLGDETLPVALKLLNDALKQQTDPEILADIRHRIRKLEKPNAVNFFSHNSSRLHF
jgi:hypothetical protein